MEPPDPQHIRRLRAELDKMVTQSRMPKKSTACWDAEYDDDIVVIRSDTRKGGRLGMWIALGIEIIKWELWGRHWVGFFKLFANVTVWKRVLSQGDRSGLPGYLRIPSPG